MADKSAGIDVHKKVLMVVVMDARKPERRRFATDHSCKRSSSIKLADPTLEEVIFDGVADQPDTIVRSASKTIAFP